MMVNNRLAALAFLLAMVFSASPTSARAPEPEDAGIRIVEIAQSRIGDHDQEGGMIGLFHGHGQAWCSEFVCWCYWQAGVPMKGGLWNFDLCLKDWNLANAAGIKRYFRKHYRYYRIEEFPADLTPKPGDYAFITDTAGERSHSAIVKEVRTGPDGIETLVTVEGNNRGRAVDIYEYPDWRNNRVGDGVVGGIGLRN